MVATAATLFVGLLAADGEERFRGVVHLDGTVRLCGESLDAVAGVVEEASLATPLIRVSPSDLTCPDAPEQIYLATTSISRIDRF